MQVESVGWKISHLRKGGARPNKLTLYQVALSNGPAPSTQEGYPENWGKEGYVCCKYKQMGLANHIK